MTSFDDLFGHHRLTREERTALVWRLASLRTQRLVETLLSEPCKPAEAPSAGQSNPDVPKDG